MSAIGRLSRLESRAEALTHLTDGKDLIATAKGILMARYRLMSDEATDRLSALAERRKRFTRRCIERHHRVITKGVIGGARSQQRKGRGPESRVPGPRRASRHLPVGHPHNGSDPPSTRIGSRV